MQSYMQRHRKIMLNVCKTARNYAYFLQRDPDILSMTAPSLPPIFSLELGKKIGRAKARTLMTEEKFNKRRTEGRKSQTSKHITTITHHLCWHIYALPNSEQQLFWKMVIMILQSIIQYGTCLWSVHISCLSSFPSLNLSHM